MNTEVSVSGFGTVFVCESCLRGEHMCYGYDHRLADDGVHAGDCKNLSADGARQCACSPQWPERAEAMRKYQTQEEKT